MTRRTEMKRACKSQLSKASAAKKMAPNSQMVNTHAPKTVICKRGGANSTDKDPTRSPDSINDPQADALRRGRNRLAFNLGLVLRELEVGLVPLPSHVFPANYSRPTYPPSARRRQRAVEVGSHQAVSGAAREDLREE
jgi:hypothetical protein